MWRKNNRSLCRVVEVNRLGVAIEGTEYEEGLSHYRCEGCNQVIEWGNLEKYGKWVEED
ncbi:MAG: hypothetical protein ACK5NU_03735 [Fusobacterium ulcerans]|uniref:hypothetical protein n=1 Tax=Fusobacterium ulcerans TaxID=861 RepID=UPI003A8452F4